MALLKRFENAEFGQLSVIVKDGKEYMDGIHVATMLGYLNPRDAIVRHCTEAGVVFHDTGVVTGKKADGSDSIQYFKRKYDRKIKKREQGIMHCKYKKKSSRIISIIKVGRCISSINNYVSETSKKSVSKCKRKIG